MSLAHRRSQVERLAKEIATLEEKLADAHGRSSRSRLAALRATGSISRSTSSNTAGTKLREARRHEEAAVGFDTKAAEITRQIAAKRKSLVAAQRDLGNAEASDRQKLQTAAERQRSQDLQRIAELERARREAPTPFRSSTGGRSLQEPKRDADAFEYDVCLSFASEQRPYVEMVARGLKAAGLRCFYDEDETVKLWGKNLTEELDRIYRIASRYCVMFISADYAQKAWTRLERRLALARALGEEGEYVLPARFDDTELPGLPPTTAYLDLNDTASATLVEFIVEKVGSSQGETGE